MSAEVRRFECNEAEARTLTDDIRRGVERVHLLLVRSYEWGAWRALGYATWADYAMAEFDMSRSYAYRLLNQSQVIAAIEAVSESPIGDTITESQTRELAPIVREHGPGAAAAVLTTIVEAGSKPTAAAIRALAESEGLRPARPAAITTRTTETTEVVDLATGEILNEEVTAEQWERENALGDILAADPDVRASNVRKRGTALLAYLHHPHPDARELASIDPALTEQIAARLSLLAAQYRNAMPRRLSAVKES